MIGYEQAIREMNEYALQAWLKACTEILNHPAELRFQGIESNELPALDKTFGRCSINTVESFRSGVSYSPGKQKYTTVGFVYVQCFGSRMKADGFSTARSLAIFIRDQFANNATEGCVRFKNAAIREGKDPKDPFYHVTMMTEFEFEEVLPFRN